MLEQRRDDLRARQMVEHLLGVLRRDGVEHIGAELGGGLVEGGGQLGQGDIRRDVFELFGGEKGEDLGERVRVDAVE